MKNQVPLDTLMTQVRSIPLSPGVYMMKESSGSILYIGKARSLQKRVLQYFQGRLHGPKISVLMNRVASVEVIETSSEADALLLEAQLVRKLKPRYNTELKDDKSYPLLKLSGDAFPRLSLTRSKTDKKAVYYGPYTDAKLLREVVKIINSLFPIRKCQRLPKTACLYYHIGQCLAPCIKPEVKSRYDQFVKEIKNFLSGGRKSLIDYLTERMHEARKEYRFEDAQFFKEQIEALVWLRKKRFDLKSPESGIGLAGTLEIKKRLEMEKLPERIVCFDVSNIQGNQAVASRVSFLREIENKLEYRRYKIKSVTGINDYAMIQEALSRMLAGIKDGREESTPDLILIDGGKGHLNAALEILQREKFEDIKILSIAKQFEFLFAPDIPNPIVLPENSPALRLLKRIRDEAHRFAITYHRTLKTKDMTKSWLDEIEGIGPKRKRELLSHFNSLEELRRASVDELTQIPGMTRDVAIRILSQAVPEESGKANGES